jgi:hypothetical protein
MSVFAQKKNQAFDVFKTFQINIERFSDAKIIILRVDNENEYVDQKFQNYLTENEINWDSRVLYVPEQNDETERLNRILMYKIRSMLNDENRKTLRNIWDKIIKTIAYLFNRSSYYQLNDKISYEMIKRVKSDLSHLRIIKSTTWVHISKKKTRKKLDDQSRQKVLVSYENDNQYRVHNFRIEKTHVVKDVRIDENTLRRNQTNDDNDADDDFWTHKDDKLLNSNFENFETQSSRTSTSSKRHALKSIVNRV